MSAVAVKERKKNKKPAGHGVPPAPAAAEKSRHSAAGAAAGAASGAGPGEVSRHRRRHMGAVRHADPAAVHHRRRREAPPLVPAGPTAEEIANEFEPMDIPTMDQISVAYQAVSFPVAFSDRERLAIEKESTDRFVLHRRLEEEERDFVYDDPKMVTVSKAMSISDADLVKQYGKIDTDGQYLDHRYSLIRNPYYSLLPVRELRAETRDDVLRRLWKEYLKPVDQRDLELIAFYQDLITLKNLEGDKEEKKEKDKTPPPTSISDEEVEKNRAFLAKNEKAIDGRTFLSKELRDQKKDVMRRVMLPDREMVRNEAARTGCKPEQIEGVRQILAFLYRNCEGTSDTKEPFVQRLVKMPPTKLLLMFYLLENDMAYKPDLERCLEATCDYVPNLDHFKSKVMSSKMKVWRQVSSDYYIDWSMMGEAARFAVGCNLPGLMRTSINGAAEAMQRFGDSGHDGGDDEKQAIVDYLHHQGNLLLTIYRSAGLTLEMPPTLIKDKKLRDRAIAIKDGFDTFMTRLRRINGDAAEPAGGAAQPGVKSAKGKVDQTRGEKKGAAITVSSNIGSIISKAAEADQIGGSVGGGIIAVAAVVGIIQDGFDAAKTARAYATDERFVHAAKAVSVTGKMLGDVTKVVSGAIHVAEQFKTVSQAAGTVLGVAAAAAGALQLTAGIMEARQVRKAEDRRHEAERGLHDLEQQPGFVRTTKHEILASFLDHEKHVEGDKMYSAGMKSIGGVMLMTGGVLTAAGVTAPVGLAIGVAGAAISIGLGMIGGRALREKTKIDAVDKVLNLDRVMTALQRKPQYAQLTGVKLDILRKEVRKELLGQKGYATYKECFSEICKTFAETLFEQSFLTPANSQEQQVYMNALSTLGLTIKADGEKSIPTVQTIYERLMK